MAEKVQTSSTGCATGAASTSTSTPASDSSVYAPSGSGHYRGSEAATAFRECHAELARHCGKYGRD